jgi:phosphoribosylpyrophosphate synthetase
LLIYCGDKAPHHVHRSIDIVALFCNGLCRLVMFSRVRGLRRLLRTLLLLTAVLLFTVQQETGKIKQLTVGPLLAQCISNIHNHKSISALFK